MRKDDALELERPATPRVAAKGGHDRRAELRQVCRVRLDRQPASARGTGEQRPDVQDPEAPPHTFQDDPTCHPDVTRKSDRGHAARTRDRTLP